ncbi:phage portal protein [Rhizobium laguerreae]|uniref:HK97 family phage portal protein n=1 Tax=Rhizobium laguerreae TaxID=1076926 RepID=A0AAX2QMJ4_9HYPH|nr:phage portal protein [Rhizobium laguerreae]TCU25294.1 HK97 family phage portal protein [Rhizobium laguerreae]
MNILRKMATFVRNLTIREPDGWVPPGQQGDAGEDVNIDTALALSAVWACVNLLAGTISSLPLVVYRDAKDGSKEIAKDHSLYRLLHDSPNYDQTAVDFWDFMCSAIELWGNAYAQISRTGGKVVALSPIRPEFMSVRRLQSGSLQYRWTQDGKSFVATDNEILHIRGAGGDALGGVSTLHVARNSFSMARAADKAAAGMFKNGLRPSGVLTFEEWLTKEQRDIAETKLAEKFVGAVNAGRPLVLEGGTKWEQLTINPEEAQMLETRGFSVEEICRFFGVPPFMIGHTSKSTSWGTGLEQQTLGFLQFTLRRRLKRIEQALMRQLLTPDDLARGISIEFNFEGLLRADSQGRARFYQIMTQIGAMTINEVRRLENLPPVDGGNVPRMQMQNVPITDAGNDALPPPNEDDAA